MNKQTMNQINQSNEIKTKYTRAFDLNIVFAKKITYCTTGNTLINTYTQTPT